MTGDPIRKAEPPVLGTTAGSGAGGMFYASVAWVNAAGQEGQASDASSMTAAAGQYMTVSATGAPANATGFNVYAGSTPNSMMLQNAAPVAPGSFYTYVPGMVSGGRAPGCGQSVQFRRRLTRTILRG